MLAGQMSTRRQPYVWRVEASAASEVATPPKVFPATEIIRLMARRVAAINPLYDAVKHPTPHCEGHPDCQIP